MLDPGREFYRVRPSVIASSRVIGNTPTNWVIIVKFRLPNFILHSHLPFHSIELMQFVDKYMLCF